MAKAITKPNTVTGLLYAALVIGGWAAIHIYSVFFHSLNAPLWQTLGLIALQCWLYAGMFIVAHDTMHGSLVPGNEKANATIGKAIMFVYAGFDWSYMRKAHHAVYQILHRIFWHKAACDFSRLHPHLYFHFWRSLSKHYHHVGGPCDTVIRAALLFRDLSHPSSCRCVS